MAASVEAKIVNGLMTHFGGISLPTGMRVAYPNVAFPGKDEHGEPLPMPEAGYVQLSVRHNTPIAQRVADTDTVYRGILLAVVYWPANDGLGDPTEFAATIRDYFAFDGVERRVILHDGIEIHVGLDTAAQLASDEQGPVYLGIPVLIPFTVYP